MQQLTLQDLLEAGVHFGHQTRRWNPKMKRYILCARNGIYIIDLNKTLHNLNKFIAKTQEVAARGGQILFVGTKTQIKDCVKEEALRCGMPYVTERWLGGMLTNYKTIRQSIARLERIEEMESTGTIEALPKKERLELMKKKEKLLTILSGIRRQNSLPSLLFVVDTLKEHIAIAEARRLRIPIGAIVDTNSEPEIVDFPIPGNDDAIKSVHLITKSIADAICEVAPSIKAEEFEKTGEKKEEGAEAESIEDIDSVSDEGEEDEEEKAKKRPRRVIRKKISKVSNE
jgi:small subunit ribosomal protein S2